MTLAAQPLDWAEAWSSNGLGNRIMSHRTRIMYIEDKSDGLVGPARIGRVTFSKTGKSLTYRGREFASLRGTGFKANFCDVESGAQYWISGCKKDGLDSLYANVVEIDEGCVRRVLGEDSKQARIQSDAQV